MSQKQKEKRVPRYTLELMTHTREWSGHFDGHQSPPLSLCCLYRKKINAKGRQCMAYLFPFFRLSCVPVFFSFCFIYFLQIICAYSGSPRIVSLYILLQVSVYFTHFSFYFVLFYFLGTNYKSSDCLLLKIMRMKYINCNSAFFF